MALDVELSEVRDFLAHHEPFDVLPAAVLDTLPARMSVEYFRRGSRLIERGRDNSHLYVLRSGAAEVHDAQGSLVDRGGEGSCFGSITLTQGNPSTFDVTAIEDSLALLLPAEDFHQLCADHPEVDSFFDAQRASRMSGAVAALQLSSTGSAILKTRVRDLVGREPVAVATTSTVREAAQVMSQHRVSSLLVMDGERLAGILTDRDLRTRVLAAGVDPGVAVTTVMTAEPVTGAVDALAFEVLLEMVGRHIHHLPIVDGTGFPVGIVTTTDLLRLEQANPVYLAGDIAKQPDVEGVATVANRLPQMVQALVEQDASADDIGRVVTAVGDAVERRVIALAEADLGPPPVPYCWVALGSRARLEQALAADQDNAILVDDSMRPEHAAWFEALAARVTDDLVTCGYPRCPGEVMATNPRWRQPLAGWRTRVHVVAAPAGARRDPGREHLLRHAAGARRRRRSSRRCSGTCSRHPPPPRCSSPTWPRTRPPTSRRWGSSAAWCSRRPATTRTPSTSSGAASAPWSSWPGRTRCRWAARR